MSKVLILMGSPRKNGNTKILCDEFERGAKEAGYVFGFGTGAPGDVKTTPAMEQAYEMGKEI